MARGRCAKPNCDMISRIGTYLPYLPAQPGRLHQARWWAGMRQAAVTLGS